ncbi:MAG: DHCW motif cupin fold protein [candidate division Zixibacteria bacterium]|nr:DHCW motif cupin fold protein [candidate division Zixibacteria bacterium]
MKIENVPYTVTNLNQIAPTEHKGESGVAYWHTFEQGNLRVRIVDYSPGYLADHWCPRGHVVLVLEGELINELKDGTRSVLTPGMSYQTQDDSINPHRSFTRTGAKLFIVD